MTPMAAKIFCSNGSHVTFLEQVRQRNENPTPRTKTSNGTLPRKLVRSVRRPWTPVSILTVAHNDVLNWTTIIDRDADRMQVSFSEDMEIDSRPSSPIITPQGKTERMQLVHSPPAVLPNPNKRYKKDDDVNGMSSQKFDFTVTDKKCVFTKPPQAPFSRNIRSASETTYEQATRNERCSGMVSSKNNASVNEDVKIHHRNNVVLYFESPLMTSKNKTNFEEKENIKLTTEENMNVDDALPLTAPIIEKDCIDFGCSPTLPRRRKSSEKREQRKNKTEGSDRKDTKEHKKGFWFGKTENKTKTNDENSVINSETKSKFKKQHRKSKSVLVPPTYLNANVPDEKTKEKSSVTRKSSVGSSPKSLTRKLSFGASPRTHHKRNTSVGNIPKETKTEKISLFRRFYSTTEKKVTEGGGDLVTPIKRSRRYTQPVGDIQKEFMRELKGKLDRYSSEHTIKSFNDKEKVIWNMHI